MRPPARYLVLIDAGGARTALLFTADRQLVAEFDASSEEVVVMSKGLPARSDAGSHEWDRALAGSSADERAAATVYTLDV